MEKIIPLCKVAQCALSDYLCLVFDDTCGQVVAADIDQFDIRFGNGCTGGNVACQSDNFGFSVRQAIDQRCDAETDRKCDDNANYPDYRAVSDRMGCVCFFLFHVFVLSEIIFGRMFLLSNANYSCNVLTTDTYCDIICIE